MCTSTCATTTWYYQTFTTEPQEVPLGSETTTPAPDPAEEPAVAPDPPEAPTTDPDDNPGADEPETQAEPSAEALKAVDESSIPA